MSHSAVTQPSLLVRIRDRADNDAWARFVEIYGPLICGFVRKQGLQDADAVAVDLVQDVLRSVVSSWPKSTRKMTLLLVRSAGWSTALFVESFEPGCSRS